MAEQKKKTGIWMATVVCTSILAVVVIAAGCKKRPAEPPDTEDQQQEQVPSEPPPEKSSEPATPDTEPVARPKLSLNAVIRSARTWGPAYKSWYGKEAPDFALTDLAGKQHKLSDYRGKDVMLVFWATWCRPCIAEIPHLITLRNIVSEKNLAMLAISKENAALIKKFATDRNINYTVFSHTGTLPAPYGSVNAIPSSFFVKPDGRIKLATSGLLSLRDMKAILQAE
ncbi:MAG: peroxiredoxin family protein [Planctomycetota bacterium]|jgi:peroxiredoxin